MAQKIGKESAGAATSKNGLFMSRPKGKTEAESKLKVRRKPMIISHHTNGAAVHPSEAKIGDWSVAKRPKGPKELASATKATDTVAKRLPKSTRSPLAR